MNRGRGAARGAGRGRNSRRVIAGLALACVLAAPGTPSLAATPTKAQGASRAPGGAAGGAGKAVSPAAAAKALAPVEEAYALLLQHYAGHINSQALIQGALAGLVNAVQDPFTQYLPPQEDSTFTGSLEGYGGIGVSIEPSAAGAVVNTVEVGSPAFHRGLQAGDLIVSVDGHNTVGASLSTISGWVRGAPGTHVTLMVRTAASTATVRYVLTRAHILPPSVFPSMPQPRVGLIRISAFTSGTAAAFRSGYDRLQRQAGPGGLRGLVLDLRDNGGGFVSAAVGVADVLAPAGPLFKIVEAGGKVIRYSAPAHPLAPPIAVLVNGETASAAEILAGVLQYTHAALLVGTRTYGKGSVQQLFSLPGGGGVKITVAHDELPNGVSWNHVGLQPDVEAQAAPPPWSQVPAFNAVGNRALNAGMVGMDVLGLQQRLTFLGYKPGTQNGIYDSQTTAAVRSFEGESGLAASGTMDAADWAALTAAVAQRVLKLQASPPPDTVLQKGLAVLDGLMAKRKR